ncbi:MAG: DUF937 domain-containing protein [Oscillospiraceae bacterium]|nr:DUF937 domain-containing protein [Oscillospiraceae bacterium]MBR3175051.1 DUF937 domain-containing protein [Oscillospiraceae bacterium]
MNLLNVLLKVLLADAAIKALSGKTGLSSSSLKKLLPLAIPLLLRYMTNNASSQSGALSLLGALTQHSNFRSAEEMLAEADEEDGGKIVQHILGDDTNRAVEMLAEETNLSSGEVNRGLNGLAPVLLTVLASAMLSANNQSNSAQQGGALDLSNLLNVFGGSSVQQPVQQSSGGLLGSLLGGNSAPAQNGSLLSALLGGSQPQQPVQQTSATGSLLNALLGGGTTVAQQPAQQASVGGSLLNALLGGGTTVAQQPVQQASKPKKPAKPAQQTVQPLQQTAQVSSGSGLLDALLGVSSAAAPTQQAVQQSANNINGNNLLSLLLGAMQ